MGAVAETSPLRSISMNSIFGCNSFAAVVGQLCNFPSPPVREQQRRRKKGGKVIINVLMCSAAVDAAAPTLSYSKKVFPSK